MQSTNPEPPPEWMLPEFDPNSVKVAQLRSILFENNIPHSYTKKANLVELFESQVRPMAPKLLQAHLSVKPSAAGIFDMRTGRYLTDADTFPAVKTPKKKSSSITLSDQPEAQTPATTSKRRTKQAASTARTPSQDSSRSKNQTDLESTPVVRQTRQNSTTDQRIQRSRQTPSTADEPSRRLGKRKASEQTLQLSEVEVEPGSGPINSRRAQHEESSTSSSDSSSIKPAKSFAPPTSAKKRRPEPPTSSTTTRSDLHNNIQSIDDELAITKKEIVRPKNRRTTLHEAIQSGEANFSDFNPFQTGSPDESSKPPRSAKRQSSSKRNSLAPSQLLKSSTTSNIFDIQSPIRPNPASQQVPDISQTAPSNRASFIPKSTTLSNLHSIQTPARESSARKSLGFPSMPSNRRLTLPHLQDDFDANNSFEHGTPEHIQQLLAPGENPIEDESFDLSFDDSMSHHQLSGHEKLQTPAPKHYSSSSQNAHPGMMHPNLPPSDSTGGLTQSRRKSQLPTRSPYGQPLHGPSNLQFQTPLPRPQTQRIKLDELVHTPHEKRLKINRAPRTAPTKSTGAFSSLSGFIGFLLRLGCLALMFGLVNWYLRQAERLGYCDTGLTSNAITRDQKIDQFLTFGEDILDEESETFSGTFRVKLGQFLEAGSIVGLLPDCQSCPPHAICDRGKIVKCETDYVKTQTDWEKIVHARIPMIMGPKCLPDTAKLIKIMEIAHDVNQILRRQRGQELCAMGMSASDEEQAKTAKVKVYGMEEEKLKELIRTKEDGQSSSSSSSSWSDEEMLELAINDLEKSGVIVRSEDGAWLATKDFKHMEIGFKCRLKLAIFKLIKKFKLIILSLTVSLIGWVYLKFTLAQLSLEKEKVRELVEITLNKLRDESWIHHTNPSLAPNPPLLASAQLRDLILSYEHSPLNRQKLWKKVEKIVEGNSNVRTKVSEIRGERIKVWEWIGSYNSELNFTHQTPVPATHSTNVGTAVNHPSSATKPPAHFSSDRPLM